MTFDYVILKSNDASNLRISHTAITDLVLGFFLNALETSEGRLSHPYRELSLASAKPLSQFHRLM